MAFQPDRPIKIELTIQAAQPALLEGLDTWLRLGLLSDSQVKRLCRERLVCPVPQVATATVPTPQTEASVALQTSPMLPIVNNPTALKSSSVLAANRQAPNFVTSMVQSFMAEISVIWLLLLGVFMVVVSSGVLAASQWQHFPPTEQYGILFGYTLAFWAASAWTGRQQSLHLTSRMLQITTLLIVPVNFWMIDGFKLWSSGSGRVVAAIAALVLTAIAMILLKPTRTRSTSVRLTINSICLSWLHWGWGWAGFPLISTYIGTVGTALVLYQQGSVLPVEAGEEESREDGLPLGIITVTFATLLLIARAVFVAHVPIHQLGLALGICGWLLCWLSRRNPARELWTKAGAVLLLAGWFVAVTAVTPWQAIAVSGLGGWLLADRLLRLQQVQDVTTLFLVGLQTCWLVWRTIPNELQQRLIESCIKIAGATFMPWALVGVGLFPYVLLTLLFASRLRRWQQPKLAVRAEFLSFILGVVLTLLSVANPPVRSLNLLLSALTLAVVTRNRSNLGRRLIYLTHVTGLAAVASGIDLFFPNLNPKAWAGILLVGMVAEWGFSVGATWLVWRRSAWNLGLVMAALSYTLLFSGLNNTSNLMWLVTPVTLSWLASRSHFPHSQLAAWLSVAALGIVQPLTLSSATPRLIGLGIATALMLLNTQRLQHLAAATLTVGFGLSFTGAVIWQAGHVTSSVGINLLAITALVLWLLQSWLKRIGTALAEIYATATDGWAIAIGSLNLILLTAYDLSVYMTPLPVSWEFILAAALTTSAIGYRNWRQSSNIGFYSLAWGVELLVAGAIASTGESLARLALAEFVLGLTAQLIGDLWTRRRSGAPPLSWHVIPLVYAGLELVFSHSTFTASTGLYTLGAALIGVGVGRRHSSFKPLTYLAVFGVSAAAYELLSYRLLQTKGEGAGDGIVLMAMLGIAIAVSVRLLSRWLVPYLRLTLRELEAIAHFHWVGSSGLLLLALLSSLSPSGEILWIVITAAVAIYALMQGRSDEIWTYAGIVEATGAIGYLLHKTVSDSILVPWSAAITCVFAYGMYVSPWGVWGWSAKPWRRAATVLPGAIVLMTSWGIALQSLLIVAAFYAWQALKTGVVRLSYISMLLTDWAILRLLNERGVTEPLWYAALLGGSLLYVAQVDPYLQSQPEREKRHLLRSLATGLVCFTALYQSEAEFLLGLITIGLSIVVILAGLALRTRAFLYVGTATFIIKVLRQLWLFINDYSLLLWAIGIVLGLAFIWIAATFEARRSQVTALVQYWMTELEAWE